MEKNTYSCRCLPGFEPTYLPAPLLSSAGPKLVFCNPTMTNGTAVEPGRTVDSASKNFTIKYYPDDPDLNYWMLAMIGIGCIFIVFVGFSIYLMW